MEELSALLIVFGFGAGVGTVAAGVLALLVGIYLNTRKSTRDDDEDESFVIPYSALGGMGGGGNTISMADIQKARAAMAGAGAAPPDKKEADIGGGNYI